MNAATTSFSRRDVLGYSVQHIHQKRICLNLSNLALSPRRMALVGVSNRLFKPPHILKGSPGMRRWISWMFLIHEEILSWGLRAIAGGGIED